MASATTAPSAAPEVPQWVKRWSTKLPNRLRDEAARLRAEADKDNHDNAAALLPSVPAAKAFEAVDVADTPHEHVSHAPASSDEASTALPSKYEFRPLMVEKAALPAVVVEPDDADLRLARAELESERRRRFAAECAAADAEARAEKAESERHSALEHAVDLSITCDGLRDEVGRLQLLLRRFDVSSTASAEDAREMADLLRRLAEEAAGVANEREANELLGGSPPGEEVDENHVITDGAKELEEQSAPKSDLEMILARRQKTEVLEMDAIAREVMANTHESLFEALERRDGTSGLLLVRADWLRMHADLESGELLPPAGTVLPAEATVSARELRRIFAKPDGGETGYRRIDMPFLTLTCLWTTPEMPDPQEETTHGVVEFLQARWEEFTTRDVRCAAHARAHARACARTASRRGVHARDG